MNSFIKLFVLNLKLFLREPVALFFTILFPLMLLLLFGAIFGNDPDAAYGGFGYIDSYVPALAAIVVGTVALQTIPISTATQREQKVLRRFKATPMRPTTYILADVLSQFIVANIGMLVVIIVAKLVFNLRFAGSAWQVYLAFTLSTLAFFSIGYIIASVMPTSRMAQAVGSVLYFPMLFLSGAAFPLTMMPSAMQTVAQFIPMTQMVILLKSLWFGLGWDMTAVLSLSIMLVLGTLISAKVFRWE